MRHVPVFVLVKKIKEKEFISYVFDLYLHVTVKFTMDLETMNYIDEIALEILMVWCVRKGEYFFNNTKHVQISGWMALLFSNKMWDRSVDIK